MSTEHLDIQLAHLLLGGKLPPDTTKAWLQHVAHCERCQALLAGERELMAMLDLGHDSAPSLSRPALDQLIGRVKNRVPVVATQRQSVVRRFLFALAATVILTAALLWQMVHPNPVPIRDTSRLPIAPELEMRVVAQLRLLTTLKDDPWLADRYDAALALEQLVLESTRP